jgi:hypothetical protein
MNVPPLSREKDGVAQIVNRKYDDKRIPDKVQSRAQAIEGQKPPIMKAVIMGED